jgi:hypothetical protein
VVLRIAGFTILSDRVPAHESEVQWFGVQWGDRNYPELRAE